MFNKQIIKFFLILSLGFILVLLLFKLMPTRLPSIEWNNDSIIPACITIVIIISSIYGFVNSHGVIRVIQMLTAWFMIFIICIVGYAFRFELNYATQRVVAVIAPSSSWNQDGQITIARSSDGHFYINTIINNVAIKFMVDTGASNMALTKQDAINLGFDLRALNYTRTYSTANGTSKAAPVQLDTVQIGDIVFKNIDATVGKGELDVSLFGMSIISLFKSFSIDKDLLVLTY